MLFWLIIATLILLAVALILLPLLRKCDLKLIDNDQRSIKIARQRLNELKQQLEEGGLSQDQFDEQYMELQQTLNDDIDTITEVSQPAGRGRWAAVLVILLVPVLSLLLYLMLGDANALKKIELQQTQQQAAANIQDMIGKLQERLKQQPDDLEGWRMLGRSYLYLQQYQNAAEVFAELNRRQPDNIETMLNYANSLAMSRNGQMTGEPASWAYKALAKAPENADALWLAGMAKAEEGDYAQALTYWQKLEAMLPADSEGLTQVRAVIAEVKTQQSKPPVQSIDIHVEVAIDPAIKNRVKAGQTVFIYAQALNGPKMPLAIIRKQVGDLPASVVLNDTLAMQPNIHLADFEQLRIVARISQSGDAMPQPGDFIGSTELNLATGNQPVGISINQEVK